MLLSISLITKKGRTIPIAYDGYKHKKRYTPVANPKRRIISIYNLALKMIKGLGRIFNIFINQFDELIIRPV